MTEQLTRSNARRIKDIANLLWVIMVLAAWNFVALIWIGIELKGR